MSLLSIFLKWKWHLFVMILGAALLSVLVSSPLITKPRFRSYAIVYPSNISAYSEETETEQMLQWLESRDIMDSMFVRFNLPQHYGISPQEEHFQSIMHFIYNRNVTVTRTQFEAVRIEVLDNDPIMARDMVKAIIDLYNSKVRRIHNQKFAEVVDSYQAMLDKKHQEIDSVLQIHYILRTQYGLFDYDNQTREVTRGHLRTVDGSNSTLINTPEVERLLANIKEKGGDFIFYNTRIYTLIEQLGLIQTDYETAWYHLNKEFTYTNIVSHPIVADKKAYPIRWLVMFYMVLAASLFSIVVIAIIENSPSLQKCFCVPKKKTEPAN
ncbi:MAG TPA: hypothetical protein VLH16_03095 [Bacteroidales bacterium]|nr:hypothetical protein [Bacteroidales bacterium]